MNNNRVLIILNSWQTLIFWGLESLLITFELRSQTTHQNPIQRQYYSRLSKRLLLLNVLKNIWISLNWIYLIINGFIIFFIWWKPIALVSHLLYQNTDKVTHFAQNLLSVLLSNKSYQKWTVIQIFIYFSDYLMF